VLFSVHVVLLWCEYSQDADATLMPSLNLAFRDSFGFMLGQHDGVDVDSQYMYGFKTAIALQLQVPPSS
jgi:hypothetical protein